MDPHSLELQLSSLSPLERSSFIHYLDLMQEQQANDTKTSKSKSSNIRVEKQLLRRFAIQNLGVATKSVDEILSRLPSEASSQLSAPEIFAVLRLLAHANAALRSPVLARRPVDFEMVFVPIDPLPLISISEGREISKPHPQPHYLSSPSTSSEAPSTISKSRLSLPPMNPFGDGPDPPKSRAFSVSSSEKPPVPPKPDSNNPFRKRLASQPHSAPSSTVNRAPPLPPRKPSMKGAPSLPPRRSVPDSSSSSIKSTDGPSKYPPTTIREPSHLIQQSLAAAEGARVTKKEPTLQVLRRSSDASSLSIKRPLRLNSTGNSTDSHRRASSFDSVHLDKSEIIATVTEALREAEDDNIPKPPPKRKPSVRVSPKLARFPASTTKWSVGDLLSGVKGKRYAMVILNQPITRKDIFHRAWDASDVRFCADGGANRLFDLFNSESRALHLPTMIKGDLDSLRPDVKAWYSTKGVPIKQDPSEYATDLMKCIQEIEAIEHASGKEYSLLLFGGLSGRIDQTMHTISMMLKLRKSRPHTYVLSDESLGWVLDEGAHAIEIDHTIMGQTCGILPVGVDSALVKTSGLKWNLDWVTSFDGDISTSNHLLPSEPVVQVTTSRPVFWCVEIRKLSSPSNTTSRRADLSTSPSSTVHVQDDITRGIKELGMGVARAAEGVKGEIGWLKGGRGNRRPSILRTGFKGEREKLVGESTDDDDDDDVRVGTGNGDEVMREEAGWKMLA